MKEFLRRLFLPHISNNYRPKLLHHKSLVITILLLFFAGFSLSAVRVNFPSVLGTSSDITSDQLLLFTNQQRQQNGLSPLSLNQQLSTAALNKANNMFEQNYWAHNSPDGKTPWYFIKGAGYNYVYAGENLARGFNAAQDVVNAWMASPEHRQNMLSANYQNVGYAVETGTLNGENTVLVVEMLGSSVYANALPSTGAAAKAQQIAAAAVSSPNPTPLATVSPQKTPVTTVTLNNNQPPKSTVQNQAFNAAPLINSIALSSNVAKTVVILFIFALLLDMLVIERKKVVRLVGHNLDHVFFLTLVLVMVTLIVRGAII